VNQTAPIIFASALAASAAALVALRVKLRHRVTQPHSAASEALRGHDRRLWYCVSAAFLLHILLIAPSLLTMIPMSCRHERPLGLPGGTGDKIAKGTPEGILNGTGEGTVPNQVVRARMLPTGRDTELARRHEEARIH
jgi:hypothetical protein